jgi:hypothetical protein
VPSSFRLHHALYADDGTLFTDYRVARTGPTEGATQFWETAGSAQAEHTHRLLGTFHRGVDEGWQLSKFTDDRQNSTQIRWIDGGLRWPICGRTCYQLYSDDELGRLALEDLQNGGRGRANSILILPLNLVLESYLALPLDFRHQKIVIENHRIDESVLAILGEVEVPGYERAWGAFSPDPARERTQARPSISLVSWVMRLGCTLAGSPGIFGVPTR